MLYIGKQMGKTKSPWLASCCKCKIFYLCQLLGTQKKVQLVAHSSTEQKAGNINET